MIHFVALVVGYAVLVAGGLALAGVAWWFLINSIYKFLGLNRLVLTATWLLIHKPQLVREWKTKLFEDGANDSND